MQDIHDLHIYSLSMDIAERIWGLVEEWDRLARNSIGEQLVRAADSIAANISEGFGRYHFKENRRFCYYARGSLFESMTWLEKAMRRGLIAPEAHRSLDNELTTLRKMLNRYIASIGG